MERYKKYHPNQLKDLTGKTFSRLTVLKRDLTRAGKRVFWLCKCICGETVSVRGENLRSGETKSCGCYNLTGDCKASKTHGRSRTPIYKCWFKMRGRCFNPKDKFYSYYGGRGIKVCDGYTNDFVLFSNDMGEKPTKQHSIDRIDNNSHYSCGKCEQCLKNNWTMNVRWATKKEQAMNTRAVRWFEHNGFRLRYFEWAEKLGTTTTRFRSYMQTNTIEDAIDFYSGNRIRKPRVLK